MKAKMFNTGEPRHKSQLLQFKQYPVPFSNSNKSTTSTTKGTAKTTVADGQPRLYNCSASQASKASVSTNNSYSNVDDEDDTAINSNYQVKRNTPILYSTNRGLHLRVTKLANNLTASTAEAAYDMRFCDLERWNTNRANHINLEETARTFTISPPASAGAVPTHNNFAPLKNSYRFSSNYARFDIH